MLVVELPFPPSVNSLFANVPGKGRVRSERYRVWSNAAGWKLKGASPMRGRVEIVVALVPPDKRKRDADNALKSVLDLLVEHALIDGDDCTVVRRVAAEWLDSGPPCVVTVRAAA